MMRGMQPLDAKKSEDDAKKTEVRADRGMDNEMQMQVRCLKSVYVLILILVLDF